MAFSVGLLAACTGASPRPDSTAEHESHRQAVLQDAYWQLAGRLAVRDARQGGTGALRWQHSPQLDVLDFRAGLGAGAWRLQVPSEGLVVLKTGGGERFTGTDVQQVLKHHLGWTLPVSKFRYWVRGISGPGPVDGGVHDRRGRLVRLVQDGWTVDFGKFSGTPALPGEIRAESGEYSVRLLVQSWTGGSEPVSDSG